VDPAFPSRVVRYALVGPDNVIATIPPGEYPAPYECAGEEVKEAGHFNFWWVKIVAGSEEDPLVGWVPAVLVAGGDDDEPIPGVPQRPTEFE
jgi:hypothetical protein